MNLLLERKFKKPTYTIGRLMVNDVLFCDTLEPTEKMIPAGTYKVAMTPSKRFGRVLPEILNVPGRVAIRIHPGNSAKDSEGCILVGKNKVVGGLVESRFHSDTLNLVLSAAKDIEITIV
jgi:hypothetical protein